MTMRDDGRYRTSRTKSDGKQGIRQTVTRCAKYKLTSDHKYKVQSSSRNTPSASPTCAQCIRKMSYQQHATAAFSATLRRLQSSASDEACVPSRNEWEMQGL